MLWVLCDLLFKTSPPVLCLFVFLVAIPPHHLRQMRPAFAHLGQLGASAGKHFAAIPGIDV